MTLLSTNVTPLQGNVPHPSCQVTLQVSSGTPWPLTELLESMNKRIREVGILASQYSISAIVSFMLLP